MSEALSRALVARGDTVRVYDASDDPTPADTLGGGDLVYLAALDSVDVASAERLSCMAPIAWLAAGAARVWIVTSGAQPAADVELDTARWQAPVWGVGRVFALEQPSRWGGAIDLAPDATPAEMAAQLLSSLDAADGDRDGEDQTAWRNGSRLAARLVHTAPPRGDGIDVRADATYLITGGFGGLGLVVGQWLAARGARTIALLGRRPDMGSDGVRAIEAAGARVVALEGDVADERVMAQHFARFGSDLPPLAGVVHAAAAFSTAPIGTLSERDVAAMLRPKIQGTVVLESLMRAQPVEWVVLFSSTTALLGAAGFAHYAAANAFLDAAARAARRNGRAITSVNWGTWEVMRLVSTTGQQSYREAGLEPLGADEACDAMSRAVSAGAADAIVARIDWSTLKPLHEARRPRPFLEHMGRVIERSAAPTGASGAAGTTTTLAQRLASIPAGGRHEALIEFVGREVAAVLGVDASVAPATDVGLFDMGMDSLMSVELRKRLERGSGLALPSTLTFNYPNIETLAGFLETQLAVADTPDSGIQASADALAAPASATQGSAVSPSATSTDAGSTDIDDLSDDELEARLLARLESLR